MRYVFNWLSLALMVSLFYFHKYTGVFILMLLILGDTFRLNWPKNFWLELKAIILTGDIHRVKEQDNAIVCSLLIFVSVLTCCENLIIEVMTFHLRDESPVYPYEIITVCIISLIIEFSVFFFMILKKQKHYMLYNLFWMISLPYLINKNSKLEMTKN